MSMNRAIWFSALMALGLSAAFAQQQSITMITPCNAAQRGTVNCPTYTAPSTTAVPRAPVDGSMNVLATTSTTLFNGAVPPNGFMVQSPASCFVNDNGPASLPPGQTGFYFSEPTIFITPPGYKPIGAVSVICGSASYVAARGW
jgi:hypothetical protein